MENLNYKILNPGGNKTAIVFGTNYSKEERKIINNKILKENSDVEQVGFLSETEKRLEMAGGEFCMNASRCAIWEYLKGKEGTIQLEVSGLNEKIAGGVTKEKEVYFRMNIDKNLNDIIEVKGIFNLIKLDRILIAVVNEFDSKKYIELLKNNEEYAKLKLKNFMKSFETCENAIGIILLEEYNKKVRINPVIWVKTLDTLFYETACGSGSLATAIYKNYTKVTKQIEVIQPSGYSINIDLGEENKYLRNVVVKGYILEE